MDIFGSHKKNVSFHVTQHMAFLNWWLFFFLCACSKKMLFLCLHNQRISEHFQLKLPRCLLHAVLMLQINKLKQWKHNPFNTLLCTSIFQNLFKKKSGDSRLLGLSTSMLSKTIHSNIQTLHSKDENVGRYVTKSASFESFLLLPFG